MNGHPIASDLPVDLAAQPVERLTSLFDAHRVRMYRLARRLVSSREDAMDLVQETFLRAARSVNSIPHGSSSEEAWLVRVLVNIRRDQWRKSGVRSRHEREADPGGQTSGNPDPEASLIARTAVWQALDLLSPRRRAIIVMAELEGLSTNAIASVLGINAITVRWHLSMGRRELTIALKPFMGGSDEHD
jgi:RNA polymerase sigma-70 factor (ECF subfamily)